MRMRRPIFCAFTLLLACRPESQRGSDAVKTGPSQQVAAEAASKSPGAGAPLDSTDFVVAGVSIGAESTHVRRVLGAPDSSEAIRPSPGGLAWYYRDLTVLFSPYDGLVAGLQITGPRFATARGLRVGDSRGRVHRLYGEAVTADSSDLQFEDQQGRVLITLLRDGLVSRLYVGVIFD
jgi:hypothetical protein